MKLRGGCCSDVMTLYSSVASIHIMCTCVPMLIHLRIEIYGASMHLSVL